MDSAKNSEVEHPQGSRKRHLLGTVSFTVCFAAWGLIRILRFRQSHLIIASSWPHFVFSGNLIGCTGPATGMLRTELNAAATSLKTPRTHSAERVVRTPRCDMT
jgi:hypothetical protein